MLKILKPPHKFWKYFLWSTCVMMYISSTLTELYCVARVESLKWLFRNLRFRWSPVAILHLLNLHTMHDIALGWSMYFIHLFTFERRFTLFFSQVKSMWYGLFAVLHSICPRNMEWTAVSFKCRLASLYICNGNSCAKIDAY